MAKKSAFALRKEEMYDFLHDNVLYVAQKENIFLTQNHAIYALTQAQEFNNLVRFKETNNSKHIDTDRDNVQALHKRLLNFIVEHNENDLIPGFILLQSETDFSQVKKEKRLNTIINKQGFNQQVLESNTSSKTFFDRRKLKPLEISLLAMMQMTPQEKIYLPYKGTYERELNVYNPNKQLLEINAYKNNTTIDPIFINSLDSCYFCHRVENNRDNHATCKKTKQYTSKVIQRTKERYHRNLYIQKQRNSGLEFNSTQVDKDYLQKILKRTLPKDTYEVAIIV